MYGGNTTEILLVSMHVTVTNKLASFAYAFVPSCLKPSYGNKRSLAYLDIFL